MQNRSPYRDADVKRLVLAGLRAEAPRLAGVSVVVTSHPRRTRGCAPLGGRALCLSLGPSADRDVAQAARILKHEIAHLHGVDHDAMNEALLYSEGPCPPWAVGLRLSRKTAR